MNPAAGRAKPRGDRRALALAAALALLAGGGWLLGRLDGGTASPAADPRREPARHAQQARDAETRRRFDEAVLMLHARQYEHAATALHRVLELAPQLPEAHVNMGFAMLGLGRTRASRDFFEAATALRADQANAYYGLALAWEAEGDLAMARGAMRSYLHLARDAGPAHQRKARAALWEWESRAATAAPAASAAGR